MRPTFPTLDRKIYGVLGFIVLTVLLDRLQFRVGPILIAGLIYLIAMIFVASWSGLTAALIDCLIIVGYIWLLRSTDWNPKLASKASGSMVASMISNGITFAIIATTSSVIAYRFRRSGMREYDARESARLAAEERAQTRAELGATRRMQDLIVQSSIDAIIGINEEGTITMWNAHAEQLFGWTSEEAIGRSIGETTLNMSINHLVESTRGAVLQRPVEMLAHTKGGAKIYIELYLAKHRTDAESLYILFARDISRRKLAENEIKELNARLEDRVGERTAQLEAANEELVGFTHSISHDLRAPLRAIVANSRLVREDAGDRLDQDAMNRLQRLEHSSLHLAALIDSLLQFARIGQVPLRIGEVDITQMAHEVGHELQADREGNLTVEDGIHVRGDAEMLRLVVTNLLENAWKYTPPGRTPEVVVRQFEDGSIEVKDRGIGFDMRYEEKIWEPFERLHRHEDYPGTGIGLANCRRIIRRHGGDIRADSEPGEGTTITFNLSPDLPHRHHQEPSGEGGLSSVGRD